MQNRREFLVKMGLLATASGLGLTACMQNRIPKHLENYQEQFFSNPLKASLAWFRNAKFGLFIHYGPNALVSNIDGRIAQNDWLQFREGYSVKQYEELAKQFRAEKFDADFITDLALSAEMKYINLTTRHHDGYCLFESKYTDFTSTNFPAKRDLVAEMAEQCQKKGLGFFLYYSHGRDWRHPHGPNNEDWGGNARPKFEDPSYKYGDEYDLQKYLNFMTNQITELLTNYGDLADIW